MNSSFPDDVATLVERERPLLDEIFGAGQYQIEDADRDSAVIRSAEFKLDIGYDRNRRRDLWVMVTLLGLPERLSIHVKVHPLDTWASFLGEEYPTLALDVDARGIIMTPPGEQLRHELETFARYKRVIFSDPQTKRDAAFFAAGYNKAYNDMCSRKGAWSEGS
jgi:hypothetical protein